MVRQLLHYSEEREPKANTSQSGKERKSSVDLSDQRDTAVIADVYQIL
jgi:hypothetical protein